MRWRRSARPRVARRRALQPARRRPATSTRLRATRDPQDEVRAENVEELLSFTPRSSASATPRARSSTSSPRSRWSRPPTRSTTRAASVTLMTLHTAKGLEYDTVFVTGVEEDLLPHRISANEPGGPAEERRLFYVGITRAKKRLYLSLAMTRSPFGDTSVAMPSRYPAGDPGRAHRLAAVAGRRELARRHAFAGAQRARLRGGRRSSATATPCLRRRRARSASGPARSPTRCATTATSPSRSATASATPTSARAR